jgi:UDP-N-acetylmuramoylalanine--D-glutamate ligase
MNFWNGQKVLILGAARQGLALARFLASKDARVTLNDKRSETELKSAREALTENSVKWRLGGHPSSLLDDCDLVCLSGGIPLELEIVTEARRRGIKISNDSQIFMEAVPCRVIGITGSAGKTTTTTLVGRMAEVSVVPPARVWVGGNIGLPLIDHLDSIKPNDTVILELSSFQLELMMTSPHVAVILNITPNHLDRHGTMEAYTAAKANLLKFQTADDTAILGREDGGAWKLRERCVGRLVSFGLARPRRGSAGTYLENGRLFWQDGEQRAEIMAQEDIRLRGMHNVMNVLAASAIGAASGFELKVMRGAVRDFGGVPHRLEFVRRYKGADWYNDSIATAPERTMAAIQSFSEPLVLLLGGRDKNLPWQKLGQLVRERVDHLILFGEAAEKINQEIGPNIPGTRPFSMTLHKSLSSAVHAAADVVEAGDVVLLSPGGTSFDEFHDFEERGERFRLWVNQLY